MKDKSRGTPVSFTFNMGTPKKPNLVELRCESDRREPADWIVDGARPSKYLKGFGKPVEVSGTYAHVEPRELEVEMQLEPGENGTLKGVEINTGIRKDRWEPVKVYPYLESFPRLTANGEVLVMVPGVKPQACFYVDFRQCLCIEQRCKKMEEEKENEE